MLLHAYGHRLVLRMDRATRWMKEALKEIRKVIPFSLIEIRPDNGSEFINHNLFQYCKDTGLAMTRSRSERKNDNCYVEQKNFDTVHKLVGYDRPQTHAQRLLALGEIPKAIKKIVSEHLASLNPLKLAGQAINLQNCRFFGRTISEGVDEHRG